MNGIVSFRLCKLTTEELIRKVDEMTDEMYQTGQTPTRHIPARPDEDYDLLVGELVQRMREVIEATPKPDTNTSLEDIRQAFADYRRAEGCACCRDIEAHKEAEKRLAELLKPEPYKDNSGFNWSLYRTPDQ